MLGEAVHPWLFLVPLPPLLASAFVWSSAAILRWPVPRTLGLGLGVGGVAAHLDLGERCLRTVLGSQAPRHQLG